MLVTDIRSVGDLVQYVGDGNQPKYLFFLGHMPKTPGVLDQSCLSNWFPSNFEIDGLSYPTAEHFMMAEKARLFEDCETLEKIRQAVSPAKAKKLGRQVRNFEQSIWIESRFDIVVRANEAKFSQNPGLGELLKRTGSKVIVEASPRDRIWGIGMEESDADADNPAAWKGTNLLGFTLMEVRSRLLQGSA